MKTETKQKPKKYRITRDDYLQLKRDKKLKLEIKGITMALFDKVKNWK